MDAVTNTFIALLLSTNGILPNTRIYHISDFIEAARYTNVTCRFSICFCNSPRTTPIGVSVSGGEYTDHSKYNTRIANAIVTEVYCAKTGVGDVYTLVARPVT